MNNLINYVKWRGDLSFSASPINEVDALIFSELVYLDFSGYTEKEPVPISAVIKKYFKDKRNKVYKDYIIKDFYMSIGKEITKLLAVTGHFERFSNILLAEYEEFVCETQPIQFAACTFQFEKDKIFVAFRGTDNTIYGWKEDCMIALSDNIPSQLKAAEYLCRVAAKYPDCKIYIGGHSKGGNLAIYSAVNADKSVKSRIERVYNNDGPGFSLSFIESDNYRELSSRITTFVPQSSFIGMLLEHDEDYIIVKSENHSFWQHNAFSWNVIGNSFVHLKEDTKDIRFAEKNMKELLAGLSTEEKKLIIDSLFQIMEEGGKVTFDDIRKAGIKNIPSMIKAFNKIDNESKKALSNGLTLLTRLSIKNRYEVSRSSNDKEKNKLKP